MEEGIQLMATSTNDNTVANLMAQDKCRILEMELMMQAACSTTSRLRKIIFIRVLLVLLEMSHF